MLWELHMATCLWHLQVDLQDKSIKLSFCPFCAYAGGEQSFLSQPHHNSALQCQLWMWKVLEAEAFMSSSTCTTTKKCALGSSPRNQLQALTASPAVAEEMMAAMVAPPGLHPRRRTPRLLPLTPRAPAPNLPHRWCHTTVDERRPATTRT